MEQVNEAPTKFCKNLVYHEYASKNLALPSLSLEVVSIRLNWTSPWPRLICSKNLAFDRGREPHVNLFSSVTLFDIMHEPRPGNLY